MSSTYSKFKRKVVRTALYQKYVDIKSKLSLNNNSEIVKTKSEWLLQFKNIFSIDVLVETGTYLGEMIIAVKDDFNEVYSIELNVDLAKEAQTHFAGVNRIKILQGDSGLVLSEILVKIHKPILFWLDAHYSSGITSRSAVFGDTPISKELEIIFTNWNVGSVILIDDAAYFTGLDNYPTIQGVKEFVDKQNLNLRVIVKNNTINIF